MRVSIRRADAALITFRPFLPRKKRRHLRKRLKQLRNSAGSIRDIDVLLERLTGGATGGGSDMTAARRRLRDKRRTLARKLQTAARHEVDRHFRRRTTRIAKRTRWRETGAEQPLIDLTRALLRPVTDRLRQAGTHDLSDLRRLHRFRVAVKRVRYAIDSLETGLDAGSCTQVRTQLSGLQSSLGRVCDHAAAVRLLEAERASLQREPSLAAIEAMILEERRLLAERQAAFVAAWESHGRDELQRALNACLA